MGMIDFHILGAGGAVPTPTHCPAAYLAVVDREPLLVDPGPGALVRLVKSGGPITNLDQLDRVLVTHLHPDHTLDLVALLFALHSPIPESEAPFYLTGPRGLARLLDQWRGIYGSWLEPRRRELVLREIDPGDSLDLTGPGEVVSFPVEHSQDRLSEATLGFTFFDADGHRVVYSGDTGPSKDLETAARDADLLVVECSTTDDLATPGHMTPSQVGRLCAAAAPRRVVLTHQYPPAADINLVPLVGRHFSGPVHQARDGEVFTVPDNT